MVAYEGQSLFKKTNKQNLNCEIKQNLSYEIKQNLSFEKKQNLTFKIKQVSPALFGKLEKSALIWRKNALIVVICGYNFSFRMKILRVSRGKTHRFFTCGAFLSRVVGECLSKCSNSKKIPLPYKNSWLRAWMHLADYLQNFAGHVAIIWIMWPHNFVQIVAGKSAFVQNNAGTQP